MPKLIVEIEMDKMLPYDEPSVFASDVLVQFAEVVAEGGVDQLLDDRMPLRRPGQSERRRRHRDVVGYARIEE